ncbi:hypothetical protein LDO26_11470 [Luteimonas sp. BDR2-5]|uniref:hypothetical protein n=1 Tax=Proluteimonas luteida TaxID=2878685 RepID=UPI001E335E59|nr:hypothetical protein [Luteimonas sp. BDR2-5]MCD9028826.1 hypothetical protein [Luteimonas sp. BDR2-5]
MKQGMRRAAMALVLGLAATGGHAAAPPKEVLPPIKSDLQADARLQGLTIEQLLGEATAAFDAGARKDAGRALDKLLQHPGFSALDPVLRHAILHEAAGIAMEEGQPRQALALSQRALALRKDERDDWYRIAVLQLHLGDTGDAAAAMTYFVRQWPDGAEHLPVELLPELLHALRGHREARTALLEALFDAGWTRRGLGAGPFWVDLAAARVEAGDAAGAGEAIARVHEPAALVQLRIDRRFDALVDRDDPRFDVGAAADAGIARLQALIAAEPTRLDLRMELTYALLTAGRNDEALAEADAALAALDGFDSQDDAIWLHNNRALALRRLARHDEALAELQRASEMREQGSINVSQVLNLGNFHTSLAQPQEALRVIEPVGRMSGYGRMVQALIQLDAALQLQRQADADAAFAYIEAQRADSARHYLAALLLRGDIERAAAALRDMLDDIDARDDALDWVQDYRRPPPLPGDVPYRERRTELLARDDVQQAVAAVGRIERHPIHALGEM